MRDNLVEKVFEWDLTCSPEALWPLISDTARMNEALGQPRYNISETFDGDSIRRRYGEMIEDGNRVRWEEPPYEWVENGWWRWRRFYEEGPLRETGGILMLMPGESGGTHIHYTLHVEPNGALGRMLVASGHLKLAARSFRKFTVKLDEYCRKPFGEFYSNYASLSTKTKSPNLPKAKNAEAKLLTQFAEWLTVAPRADRVDLRSKRLARCLNVSEPEALRACLRAVKSGDLTLRYLALCSVCRASAIEVGSLAEIPTLMACRRCGAGYHRDLSQSVEILFSVADANDGSGKYCSSGPHSAPHVLVQQNLGAMERRDLEYKLSPGTYVVRAVDGPVSEVFEIKEPGGIHVTLTNTISVAAHENGSVIENHSKREFTVTIERSEWHEDALSVANVLSEQCYHDLLPEEMLPDGDSASIDFGVVLAIGDLSGPISEYDNGAIIEHGGGHILLFFTSVKRAVGVAGKLVKAHPEARLALDCGPMTVSTLSGHMRYIGTIPDTARSLCLSGHRGVIGTSQRMNEALLESSVSLPASALIKAR